MNAFKYIMYLFTMTLAGCVAQNSSQSPEKADDAQYIVDQAIAFHGGENYEKARVSFTFRDRQYKSIRNGGRYQYERIFADKEENQVRDILTNDNFTREVNGAVTLIPDTMATKYSNSVNSVIYFAMLPYALNDAAVEKEYLGKVEIKGKSYHKIKVTFQQEGGGKDFEDQFIYWIDTESFEMTYLAYLYYTDGGGIRFRAPLTNEK